jgi:hypothetical protein
MLSHLICASVVYLVLLQPFCSTSARSEEYRKNSILHAECGYLLDKYYYDYGTCVDLTFYDLQKVKKQGVKVPESVLSQNRKIDTLLRGKWLALEKRRKELYQKLYFPKPMKDYPLCIKNLENMPAVYSGWVGFNYFKFKLANGREIDIPLKSFIRAAYKKKYSYNCEASSAIFVYGKLSQRHSTVSEINLPANINENVKLVVSGLDCDKGGKPTRIAIYVYGTLIYKGENSFSKNGWTEQVFTVPSKAFSGKRKSAETENLLFPKLKVLRKDIEAFKEHAAKLTQTTVKQAAPFLSKLKPDTDTAKVKFNWNKTYVRSMDISNKIYGRDRFIHPGNYINMEYAAKACANIGVNLTSLEIYRPESDKEMFEVTRDFAQKTSIPFLLWSSNQFFIDRDMISFKYYGKRKKLSADIDRFLNTFGKLPHFAGIQVDEPTITTKSSHYGKLLDNKAVQKAYREYILKRKNLLLKNGVSNIPGMPFTGKPKTAAERILWMEWQYFKKAYMADHFSWLFKNIQSRNLMASIVIMNENKSEPQTCSYVSMGQALPYIGTDLYGNGDVSESFAIQLLKNTTEGQAVMWPGAGYSCKSPDSFRRTMATALTHADGIHMWTYVFCSKYRDANYFWRYGGTRENCDDKGRNTLNNWRPEYWYVLKDMYGLAAKAEKYLIGRKSLAKAAILFSERTAIAANASRRTITYWQNCLNIYSDLIGSGTPLDACFVENLNCNKLTRYKYLILANAAVISADKIKTLKEWVKKGGTLIASGDIATCDQWGHPLKKSAFSDMFKYKSGSFFTKQACGNGKVYYFAAADLSKHLERIPNSGFTGKGISKYKILLTKMLAPASEKLPVKLKGLPDGVEFQIQKNGAYYIINLVDWMNKRTIKDYSLIINEPGLWELMCPLESESAKFKKVPVKRQIKLGRFNIYNMIIIKKTK